MGANPSDMGLQPIHQTLHNWHKNKITKLRVSPASVPCIYMYVGHLSVEFSEPGEYGMRHAHCKKRVANRLRVPRDPFHKIRACDQSSHATLFTFQVVSAITGVKSLSLPSDLPQSLISPKVLNTISHAYALQNKNRC